MNNKIFSQINIIYKHTYIIKSALRRKLITNDFCSKHRFRLLFRGFSPKTPSNMYRQSMYGAKTKKIMYILVKPPVKWVLRGYSSHGHANVMI